MAQWGKESACNTGGLNLGSIPGLGRSSGGGHGNPLQCSCLENPHGQRSLAGYSSWGHKESGMTESLSTRTHRVGWNINHLLCPFTLFLPTRLNALYAVLYSCLLSWETEAQRWVGSAWGVSHLLGHTKRGLSLFSPGPLRWKPGKGTTALPWGQCKICACSSHEIKRHLLLERKK